MNETANSARGRLPAVLFDAIELGLTFTIDSPEPDAVDKLRGNLREAGCLARNDAFGMTIEVPIKTADDRAIGLLEAELLISQGGKGRRIKSDSSISMNLMRLLRHDIQPQGVPVGLDENDNVVGPTDGQLLPLLRRQLSIVTQAVNAFAAVMQAALPPGTDFLEEALWLRSAEACVDIEVPGAPDVVRSLQRSALTGSVITVADQYYRASATQYFLAPSMRWWPAQSGCVLKAYAKLDDVVRAEVLCESRAAVRNVSSSKRVEVSGEEVAQLLITFGHSVEESMEQLVDHIRKAAGAQRSPWQLLAALRPLVDLAAGHRSGPGRRPSQEAQRRARAALDALLTSGSFYDFHGRVGWAHRTILDGLAVEEGPLSRSGDRPVYSIRPEFARAASSISNRI